MMDGDATAGGSTTTDGSPDRRASSGRNQDLPAPAPGDLELVRSFLALHDHADDVEASLPPTAPTVARWARGSGLVDPGEEIAEGDLLWSIEIRDALRTKVHEHAGAPRDHDAIEFLNHAAEDTGLQMCFGCDENRLHTDVEGLRGAIGRILGVAFLAELDGSFDRLRECQDPTCTSVFYDRSKNHSGKWCSMASCGNRNKVRKFRERERARAARSPAGDPATP